MAKNLRIAFFAAHSARGLVRDATTRRWTMFLTLLLAMLLLFAGSTFLQIDAREHPLWFILFWLACAWLTLTTLLLGLFDLLAVRAQSRAARQRLRETLAPSMQKHDPPKERASARPEQH